MKQLNAMSPSQWTSLLRHHEFLTKLWGSSKIKSTYNLQDCFIQNGPIELH